MKNTYLSLIAGAALIATASSFSMPAVQAQQAATPAAGEFPAGLRCIVTLDPRSDGHPKAPGTVMEKTGLSSLGTVEGVLVTMNGDWVVLKDGTYENWVPRDKVLFLRVSR